MCVVTTVTVVVVAVQMCSIRPYCSQIRIYKIKLSKISIIHCVVNIFPFSVFTPVFFFPMIKETKAEKKHTGHLFLFTSRILFSAFFSSFLLFFHSVLFQATATINTHTHESNKKRSGPRKMSTDGRIGARCIIQFCSSARRLVSVELYGRCCAVWTAPVEII